MAIKALDRLIAAGSGKVYARVQHPLYEARVYKGGRVEVERFGEVFGFRYISPEGFDHQPAAFNSAEEAEAYMLRVADATRWHYEANVNV